MRALLIHDTGHTGAVAKTNQLLAQQHQPHRRRVGNELGTHRSRNPVFAHHRSDGRAGTDAGKNFSLFDAGMVEILPGTPGISRYGYLAILVGGGPAPGINGVIASATIEAINNGLRVIGLYDGYRHIAQGGHLQSAAS